MIRPGFSFRLAAGAAAAALAGTVLAGTTAYSSYLTSIPALPAGAQAAHQALKGNDSHPAIAAMVRKLEADAAASAANLHPNASPAVLQAMSDPKQAEDLAQRVAAMSPQQQMAFAQQMSAPPASGAATAADSAVLRQLGDHQARAIELEAKHQKLGAELETLMARWQQEHVAAMPATIPCEQQPAVLQKRVELVRAQLRSTDLLTRQRPLVVEQINFADTVEAKARGSRNPLVRQGVESARQDAARGLMAYAANTDRFYTFAAPVWAEKLEADRSATLCNTLSFNEWSGS